MTATIALLRGSPRPHGLTVLLAKAITHAIGDRLIIRDVAITDLPLYDPDHDGDDRPAQWTAFRDAVKSCQGVLFVTPEWNRSVPGGLKNAIDVGSRPFGRGIWAGRPTAVVTQSPGGVGGFGCNHALRQSLVHLDAPVLAQPEMYVGGLSADKFGADGATSDAGLAKLLSSFADKYVAWVQRLA